MVVHSPIHELFDPGVWEYWAILLALGVMIAFGAMVADSEDKAHARRRQQRRRAKPPQPVRPRQQAISYRVGSEPSALPRPIPPSAQRKMPPSP